MFRIFVLAISVVALAEAGIRRSSGKGVVPEQQASASHLGAGGAASVALASHGGGDDAGGYGGYGGGDYGAGDYEGHGGAGHQIPDDGKDATGAELTSLAHSSAVQANNAVRSQHTAGSQAAFGIKSTLASAAVGAAQTAQAALVGKQAIVQGLKTQVNQAQRQLQGEIAQSGKAAAEAANAAASQHAMVAGAKRNLAHLLQELDTALHDLQQTELSAQSNAAAAGAAVVAASSKGSQGGEYHHH